MTKLSRVTCLSVAALALALIAGFQPAQAACGAPFLITSIDPSGSSYSYIITPGTDTGDGFERSSITANFGGSFWGIGVGDPIPGVGADNGLFPALAWMYIVPDYPASILTTWAASLDIDGCIDVQGPIGGRCQATVLTDVNPQTGDGVFALITTPDDPVSGDFVIVRPDGSNYNLAPAPAPGVGASDFADNELTASVDVPGLEAFDANFYLNPTGGCDTPAARVAGTTGLIQGAQVRSAVVPAGSGAPAANNLAAWNAEGGIAPLGSSSTVGVACSSGDVYLSYTLVFEGGFETGVVAGVAAPVPCGNCGNGVIDAGETCDDGNTDPGDGCDAECQIETCADADGDGFGSPGSVVCTGGADEDCDDGDPLTFPGADEQCDGLDNDCDGAVPADEDDADGDGFRGCDGDCDDNDATVFPGADELCDGLDNDCDGSIPATETDDDGDGFAECEGDCDDAEANAFPGNTETLCDGIDNDCDGATEDDVNADGDPVSFCDGDCDDNDANRYPGNAEACDGVDNDCDAGVPADEIDDDGDGLAECQGDCNDADATVSPDLPEICANNVDNDCDGAIGLDDDECDPLLVELEYFEASITREGVVLRWATAVEVDNAGFRLLRAQTRGADKAGRELVPVSGMIAAQGTPFSGAEYSFTDGSRQPAGTVLYYLEDFDTNGRRTLHGPVQVNVGGGRGENRPRQAANLGR